MSADETLQSVQNVLRGCLEDGMDPEGVRLLLELAEKASGPRRRLPSGTGRTFTRAECAEPGCPWENTDGCRFTGEHRFENRTYALVEDDG